MDSWDISALDVEAHKPAVLRSDDDARVVAINIPAGEALDDHQVHEHAYIPAAIDSFESTLMRTAR